MGCGASILEDTPRASSKSMPPGPASEHATDAASTASAGSSAGIAAGATRSTISSSIVDNVNTSSSTPLEEMLSSSGTGMARQESATKVRVTDKKRNGSHPNDGITTISSDDENVADERATPASSSGHKVHGKSAALSALQQQQQQQQQANEPGDEGSREYRAIHSNKHMLQEAAVLNLSTSDSFDRFAPPLASSTPQFKGASRFAEPDARLPPIAGRGGPAGPSNRYADISLSDEDDDGGGGGSKHFDVARWRRFYKWNKKKPADLVDFLWRRFNPETHTMYCITYRSQDRLFAAYQGDNVMHGLCCRLEARAGALDMFCLMHTLQRRHCQEDIKVLGIMIVPGAELLKALEQAVPDLSMAEGPEGQSRFQLLKADSSDPLVRQFLSGLVTGNSPIPEYTVVCTREMLPGGNLPKAYVLEETGPYPDAYTKDHAAMDALCERASRAAQNRAEVALALAEKK